MTMQTDLQLAVDKATAASGKLHDIVHGDAVSSVTTEGGEVKTVARAVADIEADIEASRAELDQKVAEAAQAAIDADVSRIVWKGAWANITSYQINDAAQHGGASYVCIQAHTDQAPPNPAFWDLMAERGSQGEQGEQGIQGPQGSIANPLEFHAFNVTADGSLEWTHDVTGTFNAADYREWTNDVPGLAYSLNTTTGNLELG